LYVGAAAQGYPIGKGADLFISVWNLHRSPYLWRDPDVYRPERFSEKFSNPDFGDKWAGGRVYGMDM
jgi:cytochrome P450 family 97 subfamily B polypeptide 3